MYHGGLHDNSELFRSKDKHIKGHSRSWDDVVDNKAKDIS